MKKTNQIILLAVAVLGVTTLATELTAADCALPACCGGAANTTAAVAAQAKPYPLETCIVSGEKLGEMGKPFTFVYKDQEIKLCCKGCKKDFDKDPEKFLKKLASAKK